MLERRAWLCLPRSGYPSLCWLAWRPFLKAEITPPETTCRNLGDARVLELIQTCLVSSNSFEMMGQGLLSFLHQSREMGHPRVFFFSLGPRLPPGRDRQLHCVIRGGWGLPSCREWHPHHSASLLLLSLHLQAPGPCHRGSGYQSLSAQGRAGRGLNCKSGPSDSESQSWAAPVVSPWPSLVPTEPQCLKHLERPPP